MLAASAALVLFFGGDDHSHAAAEYLGLAFEFAEFGQLLGDLVHNLAAVIKMHHFTPAKQHRKLHLVALFEEFDGVFDLDLAVVIIDFRPEPYLFRCHNVLFFLAQLGFALLLIQVLAVIHNPAHWRFRIRRYLDKIQTQIMGPKLSFFNINNAYLIVVFIDQADRVGSDPLVNA